MSNIIKYGNFNGVEKNTNKKQIILTHSSRNAEEYLTGLKYRGNGKYDKIPHFFIDKEGKILQLLSEEETSKIYNNKIIDKNSITICLENLGWVEKEPLKNGYINWIGSIYKGKVYEKKWRDFIFWDTYTEQQIESLIFLCKKLIKDLGIKKKFVGHNTKINGVENVEGILTRSNFFLESTDLNPSFDFEYFLKKIEDE
jgi:N-acetyl-anhydromuramyl-L-alanine amidase AmpD